ncbi:hypothetical protein Dimus_004086 [Dionaea muscipula]
MHFIWLTAKIADHSIGDVADDFYHRYKEDVKLLKKIGFPYLIFHLLARVLPRFSLQNCGDMVKVLNDPYQNLGWMLGFCDTNYSDQQDVWEESTYCKTLEITRKFANDEMITVARRVKSTGMKPLQRLLHFIVMRDTTSFMDLTRRLVNLPRVMLRHMAYVISVPCHELPSGDWLTQVFEAYHVPLDDKAGEEPKNYDYFEETFLSICQLKRENGVWWLGIGENRRRDDVVGDVNNDAPAENVE